eukprot:479324-Prymnesium_polylepis.3
MPASTAAVVPCRARDGGARDGGARGWGVGARLGVRGAWRGVCAARGLVCVGVCAARLDSLSLIRHAASP